MKGIEVGFGKIDIDKLLLLAVLCSCVYISACDAYMTQTTQFLASPKSIMTVNTEMPFEHLSLTWQVPLLEDVVCLRPFGRCRDPKTPQTLKGRSTTAPLTLAHSLSQRSHSPSIMRTRTSNRTKKYTLEKYDFESSSDNEDTPNSDPSAPTPRRRKKAAAADDDDENFDASALNESANEDEELVDLEEEGEGDGPEGEGDSDAAPAAPTPRRNPRIRKPSCSKHVRVQATGYIDVEAVATDSHVKSYMGAFDRGMRGQTLIQTWYGPRTEDVGLAQRILDRWVAWSVLPPKHVPHERGMNDRTPWASKFLEKEARFAEEWKARLEMAPTRYRTLGGEEAAKYRMEERGLPLLMGPYDAQRETVFQPGDACALSQGWVAYDAEDTAERIPTGWMFDAGGVVIGMDWAPGRGQGAAAQLLALAVIPHSDQEDYDYEAEHQKPDFQLHGTVQIWAFAAEEVDGVRRPSPSAPQLRKTICLDYGRARRVRWSPAGDHLAVLCGDGRVCVIDVDENGGGFYGMFWNHLYQRVF